MTKEKEKIAETDENLANFNWEETGEDAFFVDPAEKVKISEEKSTEETKETTEETEEEKIAKAKLLEDEDSEDFFEETIEKKVGVEGTLEQSATIWSDTARDFVEAGIFKHVEIEEGLEIDEEKFLELQEQEYEAEVTERLSIWAKQELDEDAQAFIKFKKDGGKTADFFNSLRVESKIPTGDISTEEHQDAVIRFQLSEEGWDKEEIEDRLEYLTSSGKKEKTASKYDEKLKVRAEAEKAALILKANAAKETAKANELAYKKSIKDTLDATQEVGGFKITAKDKTDLYAFLTKKDFKVSDTKSITGFQKKLAEIFQEPTKMVLLAKLVNSDFDMSSFEKGALTKETKKVKNTIEQRRGLRSVNQSRISQSTTLADLF